MQNLKPTPYLTLLFLIVFLPSFAHAQSIEFDLVIDYKEVNFTGKKIKAMAVNGSIPGPTLEMQEGDHVTINVHNKMDVSTSTHWHGILLPNRDDGVPYLTTPPIEPGTTYTFSFPIIQSGTYWYHSHTGLQEQRGVYGSIVIHPKNKDKIKVDKEYVVVISDWTDEYPMEVFRTLKRGSEYYALKKGSMQSLLGAIMDNALFDVLKRSWSRMPPMDITDVGYDSFLINGKKEDYLNAKAGELIRLRIINASSSSYFYIEFADQNMQVVSADGIDVKPFSDDRILMAVAETYDAVIKVPKSGSHEFRATAQDGSGFASLFIGEGKKVSAADIPKPDLYKMNHDHSAMNHHNMDHSNHQKHMNHKNPRPLVPYDRLMSETPTTLPKNAPKREVVLNLTGDMKNYIWSMNGKVLTEADTIKIKKGENVRFILNNKTMMHHPMHLHGHFFRVLNEHGEYSPLKHTVDVPPLGKRIIEFEADAEKDWFFHCHILYHMDAGMARVVHYEGSEMDPDIAKIRYKLYKEPWFVWSDISAMSQMSKGTITAANIRNRFDFKWKADWEGEYESEITYSRYIDRYLSIFAGVDIEKEDNEENNSKAIAGFAYLLPFLIESKVWVDNNADFRFALEKELQLTSRLAMYVESEYDTKDKWEWNVGLEYILTKKISLVAEHNSDYGTGAGIKIHF